MIFTLLGLVLIVVMSVFTYRTAKENGRRAGLWLLATIGIGVGLQYIFPMVIGTVIAIAYIASGSSQNQMAQGLEGWAWILAIASVVLSAAGMFLVIRHVSQIPDPVADEPPPPPRFDQDEQQ